MLKLIPFLMTFLFLNSNSQESVDTGIENESCLTELIHSYRLYPSEHTELDDPFYICPEMKESCCSFDSQKMIQLLWIRISQPRLQRVLSHNLGSLEFIFETMKAILLIYEKNKLPKAKKYSAECLQSLDDMEELKEAEFDAILDEMFEKIKVGFNNLYKFKRQFYCDICDLKNQNFFNPITKRVLFSVDFCQSFSNDYVQIAYFLNIELVRYYTTVKNYVQCYSNKNFLFLESLDDFKVPGEDRNIIADCKNDNVCTPFCNRYSFSAFPEIFIGRKDYLDRMVFFLKNHKPDNRGYFITEPEYVKKYKELQLQEHLENLKDADTPYDSDDEDKLNSKIYFEEQNMGGKFREEDTERVEEAMMNIYKNSFQFMKTKFVQTKMNEIKKRVLEDYDDKMVFQNFLTVHDPSINLDEYKLKIDEKGFDPYKSLDMENMYVTNSNLTLFTKEITNLVPDLLYLNETKIMEDMVKTGKLSNSEDMKEAVESFIKGKIFEKDLGSNGYLIENPYIELTGLARMRAWILVSLGLIWFS